MTSAPSPLPDETPPTDSAESKPDRVSASPDEATPKDSDGTSTASRPAAARKPSASRPKASESGSAAAKRKPATSRAVVAEAPVKSAPKSAASASATQKAKAASAATEPAGAEQAEATQKPAPTQAKKKTTSSTRTTSAQKSAAQKPAGQKAAGQKTAAQKTAAQKTAAQKASSPKTTATKSSTTKSTTQKTTPKKTTPAKTTSAKTTPAKQAQTKPTQAKPTQAKVTQSQVDSAGDAAIGSSLGSSSSAKGSTSPSTDKKTSSAVPAQGESASSRAKSADAQESGSAVKKSNSTTAAAAQTSAPKRATPAGSSGAATGAAAVATAKAAAQATSATSKPAKAPVVTISTAVSSAAKMAAQVSAADQVDAPREVSDPADGAPPQVTSDHASSGDAAVESADTEAGSETAVDAAKAWAIGTWTRTRERISTERKKAAERSAVRTAARAVRAQAAKEAADVLVAEDTEVNEKSRGAVTLSGLHKAFGDTVAVKSIDLDIPAGAFYGIVGPNGAGKTTTLSMITGLLRPDEGTVTVSGIDVWKDSAAAKRSMGTLPDRMRLFDRLTGAQLLYYSGVLRGLDNVTVRARVKSLTRAFGLEDAIGRLVSDYSAGMSKKIALACALIHSPRVLVLDEPFESVDPVSAASITEILQKYVENGGTVILSSHGMEFIERVCDNVAIIVGGELLASGTIDDVRNGSTLEERFIALVGGRKATEDLEWLHSFSD
ncbi:ABC transporter ATP-binding protein [Paramicrobacterium fandaimingii]|uniref:ABC transporter ATP-binding protein n=1 Tax=Paramicrobacterium fandaimingii TaxID=2708079 RepID=UPI001FD4F38C|nr:ABC transporter ATP-binding protein [Microbacterium fandaimingii]